MIKRIHKKFAYTFMLIILTAFIISCDNDNYYIDMGNSRLASGKLDMAKKYFEMELQYNKKSTEAYFGVGSVALKKKEYALAVKHFTKVIEIDPKIAGAYFNRGSAWNEMGNIENAIIDINKGIDMNSSNAQAYALRGDVYFKKKEYRFAIADYDKALAIEQKNEWLYLKRANYWYVNGNFKNSILDLEKAFKLNPSNITVLNDYAWLLATCSDKQYRNGEKSVQLAEKVVKICRIENTLDTLAAAYAEAGRFEDAIGIQEESIEKQKKAKGSIFLSNSERRLKSYKDKNAWTDYSKETSLVDVDSVECRGQE
jgi:tetratricopeptide (TPR) repeat protein